MIKKNILGKTGIEVSVIGFGGAPLGDLFENLDDQVCYDTLKNSHKNGINFFDTSPYYGYGLSEHRIGNYLKSESLYHARINHHLKVSDLTDDNFEIKSKEPKTEKKDNVKK